MSPNTGHMEGTEDCREGPYIRKSSGDGIDTGLFEGTKISRSWRAICTMSGFSDQSLDGAQCVKQAWVGLERLIKM